MLIYILGLTGDSCFNLKRFCCEEGAAVSLELDLLFWLI